MNVFDFITVWSSLTESMRLSLKRSVLLKRHLFNYIDFETGEYQYLNTEKLTEKDYERLDKFFLAFFLNPIFFDSFTCIDKEADMRFVHGLRFHGESKYGDDSPYSMFESDGGFFFSDTLPKEILPKDDVHLYHEILNLPFLISTKSWHGKTPLSFLKNLRWIFCYKDSGLSDDALSGIHKENLKGVALIKCGLKKIDRLVSNVPNIEFLNIADNFTHAFHLTDNIEDLDMGYVKHLGLKSIDPLKGHKLKVLGLKGNHLLRNISAASSETLKDLDCRGTSVGKTEIKDLIQTMPNCRVLHDVDLEKVEDEDDFDQEDDFEGNDTSARDAFDTDEQYNDWLNQ